MEDEKVVITVVCTGNSCRSPMAERLLRHALAAKGASGARFQVQSAGVAAAVGDPASRNSISALDKVGLNLRDHKARLLTEDQVEQSDLILTMTSDHRNAVHLLFPDAKAPVYRFREWINDGSREVPDPIGGNLDLYIETRDSLAEAIPSILKFLESEYSL